MRLASVALHDGSEAAARADGDDLVLLPYRDVGELLAHDDWRSRAAADGERVPASSVTFLPVVPRPPKIICLGRNYAAHVAETGNELPQHPVLFAKHTASLCGPYDDVPMPAVSTQLDWEVELALVVGRAGRAIPVERALEHVAGYTVSNDLSVRDWQNRTKQWHAGKAWDGLTPLGPQLVTDDELPPGAAGLDVTCEVDGVVMQKGNTDQFIFDVATILADISVFTRLEPGDVILTGTPSGVGNARDPKVFLAPGQTVVTRVAGVGELRNRIVAEPSAARRLLRPEELTDEQRALYDELCAGPRAGAAQPAGPVDAEGRLTGPFNAMLHAPAVGAPLQRLGAALRYESALPSHVREAVTCLVAGVHDSAYEWYAHAPLARRAGVDGATLEALGQGQLPSSARPELRLAHALLTGAAPQDALEELDPATVLEVSTLVGYYTTLAWQLRLFGVTAPEATDG